MEQTESSDFKFGFPNPASNTARSDFPYRHYVKHGTTLFIKQLLLVKLVVVQLVKVMRREFFLGGEEPGSEAI
jgi:hypothetical protein